MTLEMLQEMVREAGFKNSAADREDENHIWAFSIKGRGRGTNGHPKFTAHLNKSTGWLSVDGRPPVKITA